MSAPERKRKTVKPASCPNPLFEKWLIEWRDEAASRNSDLKYCFDKALESLRKYPVKLNSGKECLILKYFGNQLCVKLDRKLVEYRKTCPDGIIPAQHQQVSYQIAETKPKKPAKRKQKTITTDAQVPPKTSSEDSSPMRKKKMYVPGWRSGPYAILIALYNEQSKPNYKGHMTKNEIQEKAQPLCDSSFTKPEPGSHYTSWSSMGVIVKKGLVSRQGNPAKFSLTPEGENLAIKLLEETYFGSTKTSPIKTNPESEPHLCTQTPNNHKTSPTKPNPKTLPCLYMSDSDSDSYLTKATVTKKKSPPKVYPCAISDSDDDLPSPPWKPKTDEDIVDLTDDSIMEAPPAPSVPVRSEDIVGSSASTKHCTSASSEGSFVFLPRQFDIILLVDTAETTGKARNTLSDDPVKELTNLGAKFEVRHLKVGDFAWICRSRVHDETEMMLPYIVERKRMDDLGGSIKDGRFHEQKFRLKQCGLENVIYLVEKYGNEVRLGLPLNTLHQAAINTQVVDNFFVKFANNYHESMLYLTVLTKQFIKIFKDKTLFSCRIKDAPKMNLDDEIASLITFEEFAKTSAKNKVLKVREMFIKQLLQLKGLSVDRALAITNLYPTPRKLITALKSSATPELLLANIQCGALNRNIGPALSKTIYELYCNKNLS